MKQIYMEQTLLMLAHQNQNNPEVMIELLNSGVLKETKSGIKYLVIESKTENNGK